MIKYFKLQLKRQLRLLPVVLGVMIGLLCCMALLYGSVVRNVRRNTDVKTRIGVVGTADDPFLQVGLSALTHMDSSRFSFELVPLEEKQALQEMERGRLAAYLVIPPDFLQEALSGSVKPLQYVSRMGTAGLSAVVKEEITQVVQDIFHAAEQGIYGTWDALYENGPEEQLNDTVNDISIAFTQFVFQRSNAYTVEQLGVSDELGLAGYLFCGLSVVLLMLSVLPFALTRIRRDDSLSQLLTSRGVGCFQQIICEYSAYLMAYTAVVWCLLAAIWIAFRPDGRAAGTVLVRLTAVTVTISSLSFLLYELTDHIVTGLVLMLLVSLTLCFAGGCLYPLSFFPESIQRVAAVLPTNLARVQLASCVTGAPSVTAPLLFSSGIFLALAWLSRHVRIAFAGR